MKPRYRKNWIDFYLVFCKPAPDSFFWVSDNIVFFFLFTENLQVKMRVVAAVLSLIYMAVSFFVFISGATMAFKLDKEEWALPDNNQPNDEPVRWDLFHLLSQIKHLLAKKFDWWPGFPSSAWRAWYVLAKASSICGWFEVRRTRTGDAEETLTWRGIHKHTVYVFCCENNRKSLGMLNTSTSILSQVVLGCFREISVIALTFMTSPNLLC